MSTSSFDRPLIYLECPECSDQLAQRVREVQKKFKDFPTRQVLTNGRNTLANIQRYSNEFNMLQNVLEAHFNNTKSLSQQEYDLKKLLETLRIQFFRSEIQMNELEAIWASVRMAVDVSVGEWSMLQPLFHAVKASVMNILLRISEKGLTVKVGMDDESVYNRKVSQEV